MAEEKKGMSKRMGCFLTVAVLLILGKFLSDSGSRPSSGVTTSSQPSPAAAARTKKQEVKDSLSLVLNNWWKGGFDNIMMADFTVVNKSGTPIKDFEVTCVSSAPSGTVIDRNRKTVYEIVKTRRRFREFNMGFIAQQASRTSCDITDFELAT